MTQPIAVQVGSAPVASVTSVTSARPGSTLAPPLDRALRYRISQVRTIGGRAHRFAIERQVIFHRVAGALTAAVTLVAVSSDATDGVARHFAITAGALKDRTLLFHLDAHGMVASVDDADAVWAALIAGFSQVVTPRVGGVAVVADPAATLAALPATARLPIIASALMPILASADATAITGVKAAAMTSALLGGRATLSGTRTVTRPSPGRVVLTTVANGIGAGGATTRVQRVRTVDETTGLLVTEVETADIDLDGATQHTEQSASLTAW